MQTAILFAQPPQKAAATCLLATPADKLIYNVAIGRLKMSLHFCSAETKSKFSWLVNLLETRQQQPQTHSQGLLPPG